MKSYFPKVIVTGGAGFIGSNLVRLLLKNNYRVLNIDALTYAGNLASLADVENHSAYRFEQIDITHAEAVRRSFDDFRPDFVMHLAAESHVDGSIDGPGQFIQTNVIGTFNLLQASLRYWQSLDEKKAVRFRFLHVSTDEVYGSLQKDEAGFSETTPYDPHSPYSASKASSDHLARAWHATYGLPVLVTNCSNNYGPYQFPEKLLPVVILKCLADESIPIYGKGENIRDWLYVEDHCRALQCVLETSLPGEAYNIGSNNEWTNLALVQALCKLMDELHPCPSGKPHADKITFVPDRPGHDLRYAVDTTKIQERTNWLPQEDSQSGFRKTVQWYLGNQDWWKDILNGDYQLERQGLNSPSLRHAFHNTRNGPRQK